MKKIIEASINEVVVQMSTDIVYMQKKGWCNATNRQLKLSIVRERVCFPYDSNEKHPLLVWLCGGGFTSIDEKAWIPELTYFAKKGYVVASVEYSVDQGTVFPEPEKEVKAAIRYLRAHADEYYIDANKVVIGGESAGAYIAAFVGLTGDMPEYEEGDYKEFSSAVKGIITWYTPVKFPKITLNVMNNRPDLRQFIGDNTPPILMMHGLSDSIVSHKQSSLLYDAYVKAGKEADLYLIKDADHGAHQFVQEDIKKIMIDFMNAKL